MGFITFTGVPKGNSYGLENFRKMQLQWLTAQKECQANSSKILQATFDDSYTREAELENLKSDVCER
jgi:hypothetical protein